MTPQLAYIMAHFTASPWWESLYRWTDTDYPYDKGYAKQRALYAKTRGIVVYDRALDRLVNGFVREKDKV